MLAPVKWIAERDLHAGAKVRLFCLPHAGSGAAAFYRWKRLLPAAIDVCPVLLPGREMRLAEASITDARLLVAKLMEASRGILDVPYAIFGHSMGALLAYEWARSIQEAGLDAPVCLFPSGRNAAHLPFSHRELHRLGDEEFVAELRRRYGGMPENFLEDPELRDVFLPILRGDLKLVETYRYGPETALECPVMAFAGADDRSVSDEGLAGWGGLTRGPFACRRIPGDHFYHVGLGQTQLLELFAGALI